MMPDYRTCLISLRQGRNSIYLSRDKDFRALVKKSIQIMRYIMFLEENICCGYSLEVTHQGVLMSTYCNMFSSRNKKNVNFRASKCWLDK